MVKILILQSFQRRFKFMMHKGQSTQWILKITKDQMVFVQEGYDVWSNCKKVKQFLQTNNSNQCSSKYFAQYIPYFIVAVSFIGGENQSTRRKPPTSHKSLTNFIT
jgi:hypothetical protein